MIHSFDHIEICLGRRFSIKFPEEIYTHYHDNYSSNEQFIEKINDVITELETAKNFYKTVIENLRKMKETEGS